MQSVEYQEVNGIPEKVFNDPVQLFGDAIRQMDQIEREMLRVSESGGHVEVFSGTEENMEMRSKLSRKSRRRLERLEKKLNKKKSRE